MGRSRYKIYEPTAAHFVTCTTVKWLTIFSDPILADILFDSLDFLQKNNRLFVYAYVLMENHLHMIVSSPNLSKELGDFKSFTARKIIDRLQECGNNDLLTLLRLFKIRHKKECTYQIWQEGSHPEMIAGTEMLAQKIDYIHFNPVKRRFVELPEHWLYSSARNFAGLSGFIDITSLDELF